tara:strand:- start:2157 stop:2345 length:189 start_codon:yes stop_codon:yes gene_type:complete
MPEVVKFPDNSMLRIHGLAEEADHELTHWCYHQLEQGIPHLHLVGILQYNMQLIMSLIGDED